jgi:hypothetical protein
MTSQYFLKNNEIKKWKKDVNQYLLLKLEAPYMEKQRDLIPNQLYIEGENSKKVIQSHKRIKK